MRMGRPNSSPNLRPESRFWHSDSLSEDSYTQCNSSNVNWSSIDPAAVERYRNTVQTSLPTLLGELQHCSDPNCKSHQSAIDSVISCFHVYTVLGGNVCLRLENVPKSCLGGMIPFGHFAARLCFGTGYGRKMVALLVVCCRRLERKLSHGTSMLSDL
jgi:hypothetical protein